MNLKSDGRTEIAIVISVGVIYLLLLARPQWAKRAGPDYSHRLFALWMGLEILMQAARSNALVLSGGIESVVYPSKHPAFLAALAPYQDVLLFGILCWSSYLVFNAVREGKARLVFICGCFICMILALYMALSISLFGRIGMYLSYRLIVASDFFRGVRRSVVEAATPIRLLRLAVVPPVIFIFAEIVCIHGSRLVTRMASAFYSRWGVIVWMVYCTTGAAVWMNQRTDYLAAVSNPLWVLSSSFFDRSAPAVSGGFADAFLADFAPGGGREARPAFGAVRSRNMRVGARLRPLNLVLVVMESVGAKQLELSGAPYDDSPELLRLSDHGATFDRIYSAVPQSSEAMVGLLCSVYPYHHWQTITGIAPDLQIPSMAQVLGKQGYHTAFFHSGDLNFDGELKFLQHHGFATILDDSNLAGLPVHNEPTDPALFANALRWIRQQTSARPFFLTLWTDDTHSPYLSTHHKNYDLGDPDHNRYLNAVRSTDGFIGQLADQVAALGLADDTLIIVTGDHGEAFREHRQRGHGDTVYDEEVRVPLMIINPKLFPAALRISEVGRQIDVAPTLLDILGIDAPAQWQGWSLFDSGRVQRAYLFLSIGYFRFGLVDGNLKYIYDSNTDRSLLFDLGRDPAEKDDLSSNLSYVSAARQARPRLAAWFAFQNAYLDRIREHAAVRTP